MKKSLLTRALCLAMASAFLFLTACSETPASETDAAHTAGTDADVPSVISETLEEEKETEITRANYPDSLPKTMDFGGASYRILCQETSLSKVSQVKNEMVVEGIAGEVVNDAIFNRTQNVMDRMNVVISANVVDDVVSTLRSTIAGADPICEIAAAYAYYVTPLALENSFINWLKMEHLDLEQPWWPASLSEDLILNDKLYFISGDISLKLIQFTYCMFFNQKLADDWSIPNFYDMVHEGTWTLDKYIELTSGVSSDLNGDGKYTIEDLFGTVNNHYCDVRYAAYDIPISKKAPDGSLELCLMTEKFVEMYDKLYAYYYSSNSVYRHVDNVPGITEKMFTEDHFLLYPYLLYASESFREMESDYGIIPYPKYDEEQDHYATLAHDNYSLMCVPVYVPQDQHEMVGAVTEAMAAESYRTVTPAYLEVALKEKFLRDPDASDMIDIITGGMTFDPAVIYSASLNNIMHIGRGIYDKNEHLTSTFKKSEKVYKKVFERFNQKYFALE